jgi:hypothetical protein
MYFQLTGTNVRLLAKVINIPHRFVALQKPLY